MKKNLFIMLERTIRRFGDAGQNRKPAWYAVRSALRHRYLVSQVNGVNNIPSLTPTTDHPVYDLQGCRVVASKPGLYISNGRKFIVR